MNGSAAVYYNNILAGYLVSANNGYTFSYDEKYLSDTEMPAISLSFPKSTKEFHSKVFFPFFFGLLAEGDQKLIQCRKLGIDEDDYFTRFLRTAQNTIGAVSVMEATNE